jgi:hypothetical protein
MGKFRKKPLVIEATRYTGQNWNEIAEWMNWQNGMYPVEPVIHTLEGQLKATPGDWIIRGIKGEYYPCKTDIFQATYEAVP